MKGLHLVAAGERLSVLCLGAHSDDIEIGIGGTLLSWIAAGAELDVVWCVMGAVGERSRRREDPLQIFFGRRAGGDRGAAVQGWLLSGGSAEIKDWFEGLRTG